MPRRVWFASACVIAVLLVQSTALAPAHADDPPGTPTPTPSSATPTPTLPLPTVSPTPAGPVSHLTAALDRTRGLVATWRPGVGDTGFTAEAAVSGRTRRVETTAARASFSGLPSGMVVRITVTAHGDGGSAGPVSTTFAMPATVAGVAAASMRSVPAGILVSWRAPAAGAPGMRYLVELIGADGSRRSRLVPGSSVTVAGLTRGHLYSATVTAVTEAGRSAPVDVDGVVWLPPSAAGPGVVLPQAPSPSSRLTSPTASVVATPAAAQPTAQRTLVSSPLAAAGLAGLAVILGGLAIGLLLRRPARS
jgi:hypothetical protein